MAQFFAPQGPYELEEEGLRRRRKMAELLSQQSLQQPQPNRMAGNMVIKYSPLEGLSQMAKALVAGYADKRVDDQARDLSERRQAERQSTLKRFADTLKGTPAQEAIPEPSEEAGGGPGRAAIPAQRGNPADAYGVLAQSQDPTLQQLGIKGVVDSQKPVVVGRSLVTPSGQVIATDQTWTQEQQLAREAKEEQAKLAREQRMQELQMRLQDSRATAQDRMAMQKELAELQRQTQLTIAQGNQAIRRDLGSNRKPVAVVGDDGKPTYVQPEDAIGKAPYNSRTAGTMPATALKMQNELLEDIGIAGSINADLGSLENQIKEGKLKLGPLSNIGSQAKNAIGLSDETSRNFASFRATLEKQRNDSLRLNKGVQTEGDAQRAWNELISNVNDPAIVSQRLAEIRQINERGANLKRLQIEQMRSNFGLEGLDVSKFTSQPAMNERRQTDRRKPGRPQGQFKVLGVE